MFVSRIENERLGPQAFRQLMRRVASSVAVISTAHDGHLHGMTATAVSSVSADPPRLLIVVNKATRSHPLIEGSGRFVVNILAESQVGLGARFSGKLEDQFERIDYRLSGNGLPVLDGVAAHLECVLDTMFDVGTHTIFVGDIVDGEGSEADPLLYHEGAYKTVSPSLPASNV